MNLEFESLVENLEKNGYKIVPFAPGADIYIINTSNQDNPILMGYIPLLNIETSVFE